MVYCFYLFAFAVRRFFYCFKSSGAIGLYWVVFLILLVYGASKKIIAYEKWHLFFCLLAGLLTYQGG